MIKKILLYLIASFLFGFSMQVNYAFDLENARKINNKCALCHGLYGQGTPGSMSPRLSGLPADYLIKEMEFYRDGTRKYAPMVVASSIKSMTDKDIRDVSEYLASLDLEKMDLPEIPVYKKGDPKKGAEIFKGDCKTCHGAEARGKPKKGAPMIAGQYASYILSQIRKFKSKKRHHDDDPEDDTFDDFKQAEIDSIVAFLTNLTKTKQTERRMLLAKRTETKAERMAGMAGMRGMSGMQGMSGMAKDTLVCSAELCNEKASDDGYVGTFKITSRGDVILSPAQRDLRLVAGLQGRFKISPAGGLEFHPDTGRRNKTKDKEK